MKDLNQDQMCEKPRDHSMNIAQQHEDGLLSRLEADLLDVLTNKGVELETGSSADENDQDEHLDKPYHSALISHIYIRCQWNDVSLLREWLDQFLSTRQPDATIIAAGMATQDRTKRTLTEQQATEGYLVIGSAEQDLQGSIAEQVVEHLLAEGQIIGYTVYSFPVFF